MPGIWFVRSVNPIQTGGGQIIPTYYYWHPQIFSPSGISVLRKTEMASDFHKFHICVQLEIEKINVLRIETKSLEKSGKQEDKTQLP